MAVQSAWRSVLHLQLRSTTSTKAAWSQDTVYPCTTLWRCRVHTPTRRSVCAKAALQQEKEYLRGTHPAHKQVIERAVELAERVSRTWTTAMLPFATPPEVADIVVAVHKLAGVSGIPYGGYAQAERCRVVFVCEDQRAAVEANLEEEGGVAAIFAEGNFMFDAATHRDFLGAALGTGVERDQVGDILLAGEAGAHILTTPELVSHFEAELVQVRSVPVTARRVALSQLQVPEPQAQSIRSVEASMRLDAICSAGLRMSRSKLSDIIKKGDVRVNWKPAKVSTAVQPKDVISIAGKGRLEVVSVDMNKKGRYAVELVRYV